MSAHAVRTGVWFIGARGSVATTATAGCAAVAAGLHPAAGMVTETPPFAESGLPPVASLVFGGHDTLDCPLPKRAEVLAAGGVLPHGLPSAVQSELAAADAEIRPGGPLPGDTRTDEELVTAFAADITGFGRRNGLARTVVVNVASTEPTPAPGAQRLPASSLYAAAALRRLSVRQLHPLHRAAYPRPPNRRRGLRPSSRGPRRQDRPDPAALRARPDVRAAGPAGTGLVRHQSAGRRGRGGTGRPGRGRREERRQGTRPGRHARLRPRGRGPHRRRAGTRRLEDGLGPHRVRRFPRRAHGAPDHLAGVRLGTRRAPGARPGTAAGPRPRGGPDRPAPRTRLLLQGPGRRTCRTVRAVPGAARLRGAAAGEK